MSLGYVMPIPSLWYLILNEFEICYAYTQYVISILNEFGIGYAYIQFGISNIKWVWDMLCIYPVCDI